MCRSIAFFVVAIAALQASAEVIRPEQVRRPVQVSDLFSWKELAELELSPDGAWVAFTLNEVAEGKNRRTGDLWLVSAEGKPALPIRVTRHSADDTHPRWSPDGRRLAFLSTRGSDDEEAEIYVFDLAGGEPEQVSDHETGIVEFAFSRDGRTLYFLAEDPLSEEDQERRDKQEQDDAKEFERKFQYQHLWALDLTTREERRITAGEYHITEFEISPDGRSLAFAAAPTPLLNYEAQTEVYRVSVNGGPRKRLTENAGAETQLRWSPDGKWISFAATALRDGTMRYVAVPRLFAVSASGGQSWPLMGEIELGIAPDLAPHFWSSDGRSIVLTLEAGFLNRLVRLPMRAEGEQLVAGKSKTLYEGPRLLSLATRADASDHLAFALESATEARDVYVADASEIAKARQLTTLNPQLATLDMARSEIVRFAGKDGQPVEGLLYYPLEHRPGKRSPLLVNIHGGPLAAEKHGFYMDMYTYPHLAAARGYATLFVNYRGSSGYGDDFARAIVGAYYTKDVADILAGVDWLVERGIADRERLGIQGWSNGGILTTWITTETDRFGAAAVGAADVNWISDFGTADIALPFDTEYFQGAPWENRQLYLDKSPLFRLDRVTTPTLILHGEDDVRVPTSQGHEHFRALKIHGKAPVEMVLFPREEHTFIEIAHQRTKVEKELAWFDKHVLGDSQRPEPLAEPLEERVAQIHGLYGETIGNVLAPETVLVPASTSAPPLAFGRFEVTNAQYQYFLADHGDIAVPQAKAPFQAVAVWDVETRRFKPGYGNHPVVGVTGREAEAYCRWLSKQTGHTYRLPTAGQWARAAQCGEEAVFPWGDEFEAGQANSACRWAETTLFDAKEFFEDEQGRKLLQRRLPTRQVGSVAANEWHLYDISGNVWELCTDGEQTIARGGSWSSTPAELRVEARLKLDAGQRRGDVGFRVVREGTKP